VRGRIGYLWGNGQVLSYVTGGLAYGKVDLKGTNTVSGLVGLNSFSVTHPIGHSQVNTGWVVGYGTEGRLGATNWTWKIEGLYMDLGHLDDSDAAPVPTGGQVFTNTHFTDWILRGGLNYQFPANPRVSVRG
jgi:opacity protein-like surface antigen